MYNCPNCGAPINADVCPYCGTAFLDWSALDINKPNWIKLKLGNHIVIIKASITDFSYNYGDPDTLYFCDNQKCKQIQSHQELNIDISLSAIPFSINDKYRSNLMVEIDPEVADNMAVGEFLSEIMKGK